MYNRFPVNPEFAQEFEERIRNRPRQVEQQPGFIRVQLLRPSTPTDPYIVLMLWESNEVFERWVKADSFTNAHAGPRQLAAAALRGPTQIEAYTVILDSVGANDS
jgi:heme-degrading monooxygenase HmoA